MSESSNNKHLKPYDYKIDCPDNDDVIVKKIYAKAPDYVIYRTDTSIHIDMDDDSAELKKYAENHYKIGVDLARIYSWLPEKPGKAWIREQCQRLALFVNPQIFMILCNESVGAM